MNSITWLNLLIIILASFRLTHLIVFDEITSFLRKPFLTIEYIQDDAGKEFRQIELKGSGIRRWIGLLLSCHWCVGVWSSLIVVVIYAMLPGLYPLLLILAIAGGAAVIESKL